jgi:hypothetical protein
VYFLILQKKTYYITKKLSARIVLNKKKKAMATMAMLAGYEPRPSEGSTKAVGSQKRHLSLSYEQNNYPTKTKNRTNLTSQTTLSHTPVSDPNQSMDPPYGDKTYQRHQVEKLGYRFHQKKFSSRGSGTYRSAEMHNDLRTLLANVSNPKFEKKKFSKKMYQNDVNKTSSERTVISKHKHSNLCSTVLNSDGVAAAFTTYERPEVTERAPATTAGAPGVIIGEPVAPSSIPDAKQRLQPSMVSTLPIGWEKGSSWNSDAENRFETSSQRQNTGKVICEPKSDHRRLGRNRNVSRSQIVFG